MFTLNEKVVYPGHGVAKVNRIIEKIISNKITTFYELTFIHKDMTVLVPTENLPSAGIRKVSSHENIEDVFKLLAEPSKKGNDLVVSNWNKRNKDYQIKLRSGNVFEISKIYRDLKSISQYKELSFGERNLLNQTETLLAEEISVVKNLGEEKALEHLRALFKTAGQAYL